MKILIFGHMGQIAEYAEYLKALKRVGQIQSLLLTMGREEAEFGVNVGAFDSVQDILPTQSELDDVDAASNGAAQSLMELEARFGSSFVNRDILMDRYFRGQPVIEVDLNTVPLIWTGSRTKQFMCLTYKRLEQAITAFEPDFMLLEKVTAPFRIAWRLGYELGVPAGKFMPVRFWPNRLYLETGIGYDWHQARVAYDELKERPLTGAELIEVKQKLKTVRHEKIKPAYLQTEHAKGAPNFMRRLYSSRLFAGLYAWLGSRSRTCTINPQVLPGRVFSPIAKYRRYRNGLKAKRYLLRHQTPFHKIEKKKYAIYFLHVQPEVTVDGMAFDYQDQESTLRNILAALPANMELVVKEHSPMLGFRPLEGYAKLVHMPGVILAETHEDSHKLITHASVVVTLTGTVALEAVMYGIPAIVLGSIYFDKFNGVYKPESLNELRKLLSNPGQLQGATDDDALRALGSLLRASRPGTPPLGDAGVLQEVDVESAEAMMSELQSLESAYRTR